MASTSLNITQAAAALIAACGALGKTLTDEQARAAVKTGNVKSMKRVNETAEKLAKPATRRIRSERVIEAGPRGFRFTSKSWLDSVKAGAGIAVHPSNINKLKAHAKAMGVSSAGTDMVAMAALITEAGLTPAEEAAAE